MPFITIDRRRGARPTRLVLHLEVEREHDQRWIAEIPELPGVICYGPTRRNAIDNAALLALRIIDERSAHGEPLPDFEATEALVEEHLHA